MVATACWIVRTSVLTSAALRSGWLAIITDRLSTSRLRGHMSLRYDMRHLRFRGSLNGLSAS